MARLVFRTVLAAVLSVPFAAIFFNEAPAQQRATCSQARSQCGKQRVCQRRYDLYGNWLLDCRICKKMRVSEGNKWCGSRSRLCV